MITSFTCNQFVRIGINFQSLKCDIKYNFNSNCTIVMFLSLYQHVLQLGVVNSLALGVSVGIITQCGGSDFGGRDSGSSCML